MSDVRLPATWAIARIEDVSRAVGGATPSKFNQAYWDQGTIPWVSPKDMKTFDVRGSEDYVNEKALAQLSLVPSGSVLVVVRSGILSRTLPVGVNTPSVTINQDMRALIPEPGISPRYLAWQLVSKEQEIMSSCLKHGTTVASIEGPAFARFPVAVAPAAEQTRIVEKLEELLSDLDVGVTELKAAQKKVALFRLSLTKAALDGTLTVDWRAERARHTEVLETGEHLLQRILAERRAHWEAKQLAKFKEQGKEAPKEWKDKYPEPVQPDTTSLPKLPEGWVWTSLDMLGEIVSGVTKSPKRTLNIPLREVPYLRVANVQRGYLDLTDVKTILATDRDIKELTLQNGDVLFNEGGDRDKLGRGWVWRDEIAGCIHQNHVFRMRPYLPDTLPELVSHHGNTFGQIWFQSAGKQTTNLASINMGILRAFPVPVPPAAEQREILRRLDRQLEALNAQEKSIELGLKQSEAQRKNILRTAFSGQLIPQDSKDEPASVLLDQIRAKRAELKKQPRTRRTQTKKEVIKMTRLLKDVLTEAGDWLPAQEAFKRCGVGDGSETDQIQALYAELRVLDKSHQLAVEPVRDSQGRKLYDRLKLLTTV